MVACISMVRLYIILGCYDLYMCHRVASALIQLDIGSAVYERSIHCVMLAVVRPPSPCSKLFAVHFL